MLPVELDIRVFEELERLFGGIETVTPQAVVDELSALSGTGGTSGRAAQVGHALAGKHCTVQSTATTIADDAVLEVAEREFRAVVVTADRELSERAKARGIPVVRPRQSRTLMLDQP